MIDENEQAADTGETVEIEEAAEIEETADTEQAAETEKTADENKLGEVLIPIRELLSPRAFFRRTFKLDRFSVLSGDNKYKLEVLTEIHKRRDLAFRFACIFCVALLVYSMVMGLFSFNMLLANRRYWYSGYLPPVGLAVLLPVPLVFIPALSAALMKQTGTLAVIIVFMGISAYYIIYGYYYFVPFTVFGAIVYLRQNAVIDIYEALSLEDGFPEFSDFTFEHIGKNQDKQNAINDKKDND
jgi:hypothetical protein